VPPPNLKICRISKLRLLLKGNGLTASTNRNESPSKRVSVRQRDPSDTMGEGSAARVRVKTSADSSTKRSAQKCRSSKPGNKREKHEARMPYLGTKKRNEGPQIGSARSKGEGRRVSSLSPK